MQPVQQPIQQQQAMNQQPKGVLPPAGPAGMVAGQMSQGSSLNPSLNPPSSSSSTSSSSKQQQQLSRGGAYPVGGYESLPRVEDLLIPFQDFGMGGLVGPFGPLAMMQGGGMMGGMGMGGSPASMSLKVDICENPADYSIVADVPGYTRDNINVEVDDQSRMLTIATQKCGTREEDVPRTGGLSSYHRIERFSGCASRSLRLPANADLTRLTARVENGVLRLSVPKAVGMTATGRRRIDLNA
jgi:HSP20 family molecular chaperone IbpA